MTTNDDVIVTVGTIGLQFVLYTNEYKSHRSPPEGAKSANFTTIVVTRATPTSTRRKRPLCAKYVDVVCRSNRLPTPPYKRQ